MDNQDNADALSKLDELDAEHGVNQNVEEVEVEKTDPVRSLGKARTYEGDLSAAEESPWKILNLDLLPSKGMFYPEGIELLIRSARTKEIRHWSTMDDTDPIDIRENINFVLNACTKLKIKGNPQPFNFNDLVEVDKYHIIFRIYELTFPNQENKLMAGLRCPNNKCKHANRTQATSQNLLGFEIPEELIQYYDHEKRCFFIQSEKLNEEFGIFLPYSGILNKFRQKRKAEIKNGVEIDEAFYRYGPYLVKDWRQLSMDDISSIKQETGAWSEHKFTVIYKITEMLRKAAINRLTGVCEKCKTRLESSIFLGGSFTVKDIFIVSARLDELI